NVKSYDINIADNGVHITPSVPAASAPTAVPQAPATPAPPAPPAPVVPPAVSVVPDTGVTIHLPKNATNDEIKEAIEEAKSQMEEKIAEAQSQVEEAIAEAKPSVRTVRAFRPGDHMVGFMVLWIF